jgi:hypothetical protein
LIDSIQASTHRFRYLIATQFAILIRIPSFEHASEESWATLRATGAGAFATSEPSHEVRHRARIGTHFFHGKLSVAILI